MDVKTCNAHNVSVSDKPQKQKGLYLCEQKGGSVVEEVLKTDHFL